MVGELATRYQNSGVAYHGLSFPSLDDFSRWYKGLRLGGICRLHFHLVIFECVKPNVCGMVGHNGEVGKVPGDSVCPYHVPQVPTPYCRKGCDHHFEYRNAQDAEIV
jgi:hypothetical protein